MQELAAQDEGTPVPRSRRGRGAPAATQGAADDLFVLSLHERHSLDPPDARAAATAAATTDAFAGMQLVASRQQWKAPPLPMCAPPSSARDRSDRTTDRHDRVE